MEGAELHPSEAEIFRRISEESTDIGADVWDAENVHFDGSDDGHPQVAETGLIVSSPMSRVLSGAWE